jgi:Ca-activated chloride channel family protein
MRYKYPLVFLALLVYIPLLWRYIRAQRSRRVSVRFSDMRTMDALRPTLMVRLRHAPFVLQCIGIALLVTALARPQKGHTTREVTTHGVDIVLLMDISTSMRSLDFKPKNRLHVAKQVVKEFVKKREHDRIGLVVFAARAFTKCPLTLDHDIITRFIDDISFGDIEDGTAIGTAIATAGNRLKDSPADSKIMVLLTDGENNRGEISPRAAARAVGELDVKIYTVGVGKEGKVPAQVQIVNPFTGEVVGQDMRMVESRLDEEALMDIADITGGRFFRAENPEKLQQIYSTIDSLETTEIRTKTYTNYADRFFPFLCAGVVCLVIAFVLQHTWMREVP